MSSKMIIYHNPRCRKSQETLQILLDAGYTPKIIHYLDESLTVKELAEIIKKMRKNVQDIFRKSEKLYRELNIQNSNFSDEILLEYLHKYPSLMERPIVVKGDQAILGRPPENVKSIL